MRRSGEGGGFGDRKTQEKRGVENKSPAGSREVQQ